MHIYIYIYISHSRSHSLPPPHLSSFGSLDSPLPWLWLSPRLSPLHSMARDASASALCLGVFHLTQSSLAEPSCFSVRALPVLAKLVLCVPSACVVGQLVAADPSRCQRGHKANASSDALRLLDEARCD